MVLFLFSQIFFSSIMENSSIHKDNLYKSLILKAGLFLMLLLKTWQALKQLTQQKMWTMPMQANGSFGNAITTVSTWQVASSSPCTFCW